MADNIKRKVQLKLLILLLTALCIIVLSIFFVFKLAANQQARDFYNWQIQLGRVADNRQAEVESWIDRQFNELSSLADNTSLRLYIMDLARTTKIKKIEDEPFQAVYLRNLLVVTSERSGFGYKSDIPNIAANVNLGGVAGIALLNKEREVIVSTYKMPAIQGELKNFISRIVPGGKGLSDIYKEPSGNMVIAFAVPVFEVQGQNTPDSQIGMVVGVRTVEDSLFELLRKPSEGERTMETMLVEPDYPNNSVRYVSGLKDGSKPLAKKVDINNKDLEASFAVMHPGRVEIKKDYNYNDVLVTGRAIDGAPWFLVQKINRDEALAESDARKHTFIITGVSIVLMLAMFMFVVWRHSMSVRAERTAQRFKRLAEKYAVQRELLKMVADSKPEAIFVFNQQDKCCFANREAARSAGVEEHEIHGKSLAVMVGGANADIYAKMNAIALLENRVVSFVHASSDEQRIIQSKHVPLEHIPGYEGRGVLVLDQDISEALDQHRKILNNKHAIIETLVAIMDRRDHFTADHSSEVAKLSRIIAEEMQLEPAMAETAQIAGLLLNLGRVFVPLDILTKKDKLTDGEKETIQESLKLSADLLSHIEFDGPVMETIKQAQDTPKYIDVLISAIIVKYANIFVSMLSPRSYREKVQIEQAIEQLQQMAQTQDERSVVAVILNYIENKGGREYWEGKF